jgi:secreted trypsin-like serine protease
MVGENVRQAKEHEFPYIVSIKIINNGNREPENDHGCTGTILSQKDVLTVAHGLDNIPMIKIEVVVGSNDIRQGRKYHPYDFITFNSWAQKKKKRTQYANNDIAILKVNH